jgi:hypothetical protein
VITLRIERLSVVISSDFNQAQDEIQIWFLVVSHNDLHFRDVQDGYSNALLYDEFILDYHRYVTSVIRKPAASPAMNIAGRTQ